MKSKQCCVSKYTYKILKGLENLDDNRVKNNKEKTHTQTHTHIALKLEA